jgi:prolyl-tRNA editing enzyme YbaK/EbsC (Cys-tRNA(Pro) deacylase)
VSETLLARPAVRRVQAALVAAGSAAEVIALTDTARTAEDAAQALGCELGAIVKSLVFAVNGRAVLALVAGDQRCDTRRLAAVLGIAGKIERADADFVLQACGQSIGGVAPIGHPSPLPTAIDVSFTRFTRLYAAAGHPHCVFPTGLAELERLCAARAGAITTYKN